MREKGGKMRVEKNGEIDSIEEVSNKDLEIKKPIVKVQEADNIHSVNSILSRIIKNDHFCHNKPSFKTPKL